MIFRQVSSDETSEFELHASHIPGNLSLPEGFVWKGTPSSERFLWRRISIDTKTLLAVFCFSFFADLLAQTPPMDTLHLSKGLTYIGILSGKHHLDGKGKIIYLDAVYEGEWKNGKEEGMGIIKFNNGNVYEGHWEKGKPSGMGVLKHYAGYVYSGEWKSGRPDGEGELKWDTGEYYQGHFKNGKFEGHGKYIFSSGDIYDGEYKKGRKNGLGMYKWVEGQSYNGTWKKNEKDGHGIYTWEDGSIYEGRWKADKAYGKGILKTKSGFTYTGRWKDNFWDGGTIRIPHGKMKTAKPEKDKAGG